VRAGRADKCALHLCQQNGQSLGRICQTSIQMSSPLAHADHGLRGRRERRDRCEGQRVKVAEDGPVYSATRPRAHSGTSDDHSPAER
jgi:hypothetical protein